MRDFPIPGILFKDITPLFSDNLGLDAALNGPEGLSDVTLRSVINS